MQNYSNCRGSVNIFTGLVLAFFLNNFLLVFVMCRLKLKVNCWSNLISLHALFFFTSTSSKQSLLYVATKLIADFFYFFCGLYSVCRKCIYDKITDEELESCPICGIDLGCVPLEKLRSVPGFN